MSNVTAITKRRRRGDCPPVPPEPWGAPLRRCRKASGYNDTRDLDGARHILGFGRGPAHELETMDHLPTELEDRRKAYKLIVFYGYDPADFGLGDDDRPPAVDLDALRELGKSSTKWYTAAAA